MKIVIWTKSPPKVEAIKEAVKNYIYFKNKDIEIIEIKAASDISDMPTSIEENMLWAKNRAENAKKEIKDADFYIWMEGWTSFFWEKSYLFWVVYIIDKNSKWHFGFSNMMEVPEYFHKKIYYEKLELWPILEEATWVENASKKNWAFWAWSDDSLTRKDQFIFAFMSAIPALINTMNCNEFFKKYYK